MDPDADLTALHLSLDGASLSANGAFIDSGLTTLDGEVIYLVVADDGASVYGCTRQASQTGSTFTAVRTVFKIQVDFDAADHEGSTLGLVLYEPIAHDGDAATAQDVLTLAADTLYLVSKEVSPPSTDDLTVSISDFSSAPSGQNYWLGFQSDKTFYSDSSTSGTASLLISGRTSADTVNTSTIGIGSNSQAVDPSEGVNFRFVTDLAAGDTKDPSGASYEALIDVDSFSFALVQVQGSPRNTARVGVTAVDVDPGDGQTPTISSVTVTYKGKTAVFSLSGGVIAPTGTATLTGITASLVDGTIVLGGLKTNYTVTVDGEGLNDVLVTNADSKWGFDLGAFSFTGETWVPGTTTFEYTDIGGLVAFKDDVPSWDDITDPDSTITWAAGESSTDNDLGGVTGADEEGSSYKIVLNTDSDPESEFDGLDGFTATLNPDGTELVWSKGGVDYLQVTLDAQAGTYDVEALADMPLVDVLGSSQGIQFTKASGPLQTLRFDLDGGSKLTFDGLIFGSSKSLTGAGSALGEDWLLSTDDNFNPNNGSDDLNPDSLGFGIKSGQASQFNQNEGFMASAAGQEIGSLSFGIEWISGAVKTMYVEYWIVDGNAVIQHGFDQLYRSKDNSYTIDVDAADVTGFDAVYVRTSFDSSNAGVRLVNFSVEMIEQEAPDDLDFTFGVQLTDGDGDSTEVLTVGVLTQAPTTP